MPRYKNKQKKKWRRSSGGYYDASMFDKDRARARRKRRRRRRR